MVVKFGKMGVVLEEINWVIHQAESLLLDLRPCKIHKNLNPLIRKDPWCIRVAESYRTFEVVFLEIG